MSLGTRRMIIMMIDECEYFAIVCMCAIWVNARLSNTLHWLPQRRKCDDDDDDGDDAHL